LEISKLGAKPYGHVVRFIVREDEDADQIISDKREAGEITPDTLAIVRQIVGRSALSAGFTYLQRQQTLERCDRTPQGCNSATSGTRVTNPGESNCASVE
jgi:hypothetical protein